MLIAFHAKCVAVEDLTDLWLVGFADTEVDTRQYLTLQRAYEDDEQDVKLGMNTYHVERDDQLFSGYGGIERFEVQRDHLEVQFTPAGTKALKTEKIRITFTLEGSQYQKMLNRLQRIFVGTDCLVIHAS